MPTPVGHAAGGIAAGLLTLATRRIPATLPLIVAFGVLATAPDLDLLLGSHRTYTHSIGAVAVAGVLTWLVLSGTRHRLATSLAAAAAYGSHLLLDWLGRDSSVPPGLTILWPFSSAFYISGLDLFKEVSRRYWNPEEFIFGNLRAVGWELVLLVPVAAMAWWVSAVVTKNEERKTKNE